MTALSKDRPTIERAGQSFGLPVGAGQRLHKGALVCATATGFAVKGVAAAGLIAMGRSLEAVDNSAGGDGAATVQIEPGIFLWDNSAGADEIGPAHVGGTAWIVDDQTVARTPGATLRSPAGRIVAVEDAGVWVDTRPGAGPVRRLCLPIRVADLSGSGVYRAVAPVDGAITKIWSVLNGALTVGDATLTARVGTTLVTGGVVTIAQAGSAAGDVDSAVPTASAAVTAGAVVSLTVGGTNTAGVSADVLVEIIH